jgi:glyoxylase-like metal-dependent hydrolase (beta-lactamase superfamily II)
VGEQRGRRQRPDPRRRQLDRERQAVEAPADLDDRGKHLGREAKTWITSASALGEQLHRRRSSGEIASILVGIRRAERREREHALSGEIEHVPARHQHAQLRAGVDQPGDLRGRRLDVLEVVEDEQCAFLAQRGLDRITRRRSGQEPALGRGRDRRQHELRIFEPAQLDGERAVAKGVRLRLGDGQRDPGLPDPGGPVTVTSRVSGSENASASTATSRSRPISLSPEAGTKGLFQTITPALARITAAGLSALEGASHASTCDPGTSRRVDRTHRRRHRAKGQRVVTEPRETAESIDQIAEGVWHWRIRNSRIGGTVSSSHAVSAADGSVLVDPVRLDDDALAQLREPKAIVLTAACHQRSAWRYRAELGLEVWLPEGSRATDEEPDRHYSADDLLPGGLRAVHTPGPEKPHYCLLLEREPRVVFCSDLLMGDGALELVPGAYHEDPDETRRSVERLLDLDFSILCLAHGPPVSDDPKQAIRDLLAA